MKIYNHKRVKDHWHPLTFNFSTFAHSGMGPCTNDLRQYESKYRVFVLDKFPGRLNYTLYFESQEDATYFMLKYS